MSEIDATTTAPPSVHEKTKEQQQEQAQAQEFYATERDEKEAAGLDLHQIKTSESGIEYPIGLKLGLITLALCLSVFLMALVYMFSHHGAGRLMAY